LREVGGVNQLVGYAAPAAICGPPSPEVQDPVGYAKRVSLKLAGDSLELYSSDLFASDKVAPGGGWRPTFGETTATFTLIDGRLKIDEVTREFLVDPDSLERAATVDSTSNRTQTEVLSKTTAEQGEIGAGHSAETSDPTPPFGAMDLAFPVASPPAGWRSVGDADGGRREREFRVALLRAAAKAGVSTDDWTLEVRVLTSAAGVAVVAFVELDRPLRADVRASWGDAGATGVVRRVYEFGSPLRLVIVEAPGEAEAGLAALLKSLSAARLARRARDLNASDKAASEAMAESAASLDAKNSLARLLLGIYSKDRTRAIAHFRAALERGGTDLDDDDTTELIGSLGTALLLSVADRSGAEVAAVLAEARERLEVAIRRSEGHQFGLGMPHLSQKTEAVFRYNLACACARLGETEKSFAQLTKSLEAGVGGDWHRDSDLVSLHGDPRWSELLRRFPVTQK
jgi:hypothetical protein